METECWRPTESSLSPQLSSDHYIRVKKQSKTGGRRRIREKTPGAHRKLEMFLVSTARLENFRIPGALGEVQGRPLPNRGQNEP